MRAHKLFIVLALLGLILSACSPSGAGPAASTSTPQATPAGPGVPNGGTPTGVVPPGDIPAAAQSARQVLAQQLHVSLEEVVVRSVEKVDWPDKCLGVVIRGMLCAQGVTPGYKVVLENNGEQYEYHTDETGGTILLASAPEPELEDVAVIWEQPGGLCETAQISPHGVAFGTCGGPLVVGQFASQTRAEDLAYFVQTYAPFEADTPAGRVTFKGQGEKQPTPAEQRMIAEWAHLVFVEAAGGRSGASYGLALAWHREGGIAGFCNDLAVYVTGEVYATSCAGGQPQDLGRSRLDAPQLEQLFAWIDSLKSFEIDQTDPATADAMTIRLVFSGAGSKEPTEAEKQAILDFAAGLYTRFEPGAPPTGDLGKAHDALVAYFSALNAGDYASAVQHYGGSYEVLMGYNPNIPADDHKALFESGCRYSGLVCTLAIRNFVKEEQLSPQEFKFTLEFSNPDGSLFELGPCCGEDPNSRPPISQFDYTVMKEGDRFLVQDLPVYVP